MRITIFCRTGDFAREFFTLRTECFSVWFIRIQLKKISYYKIGIRLGQNKYYEKNFGKKEMVKNANNNK